MGSSQLQSTRVSAALVAGYLACTALLGGPDDNRRLKTDRGPLKVTPFEHATFVIEWNGNVIYNDPVGGAERFKGTPPPDLILITDIHGDHLNTATVKAVKEGATTIVAPPAVVAKLKDGGVSGENVRELANGKSTKIGEITVEAIPMYNLTAERKKFHAKGRGNGYVLGLGATRVYISGDTEDIPEMRALKKIDVAFVCMNLPYTMTAEQAASATLDFAPRIVYPYHYRGGQGGTQDPKKFKSLVEAKSKSIEVRVLDWY